MLRNNIDILSNELSNLVKRLDIDRDLKISFSEFKKLFNLQTSLSQLSFSKSSSSLLNKNQEITKKDFNTNFGSPRLRSTFRDTSSKLNNYNIVSRLYSPLRNRTLGILNKSAERFDLDRSIRSPDRGMTARLNASNSLNRNLIRNENLVSYEEENFINFIKSLIEIENEVEKAKIDLTYKTDFNIEDVFINFELEGRGYITDVDVKFGLNAFDVFPTREEISLLMKRYDILNEGVIR